MAETTQINKFRQKKLRNLSSKTKHKDDTLSNEYFYPKQNLYTRQEFELLDTIYSDEPSTIPEAINKEDAQLSDFWPQNKEDYLNVAQSKNNFFKNLTWFMAGVMSTSAVWLIYFQLSVHQIKSKADTQIVFQKSANIMTDKTVDKVATQTLEKQKTEALVQNENNQAIVSQAVQASKPVVIPWVNWFNVPPKKVEAPKQVLPSLPQQAVKATVPQAQITPKVRYHTIGNGDSLWIVANKYYSNPSPENISKIMKANNMKRVGILSVGQKIVVP